MKKNIIRVISLVLALGMVLAMTACTQKVEIRFVKADGSDIDWAAIGGGNGGSSNTGSSDSTPVDNTPVNNTPVDNTPATEAPTAAPADGGAATPENTTAAPAATPEASTAAPAASTGGMPTTKDAIVAFYKTAANNAKAGQCGYTKIEYQAVGNLNITGNSMVDGVIENILGGYMTKEDAAEPQVCAKGSDEAKNRFAAAFTGDASLVKSAECVQDGSNYKITIVTVSEDTPQNKAGSKLAGITQSILYWEDIDNELKKVSQLKEYSDIHVVYNEVKIEAVMTPAGQFVSLSHTANVDINIGHAKILIVSIDGKSAHLDNYAKYSSFSY